MEFYPVMFTGAVLLFALVAIAMVLGSLLLGWFVRPRRPDPVKDDIYECGEPTIGPGMVQFDMRFYVVALLFIIFDVEVAFFFPWAVVFGKANTLANTRLTEAQRVQVSAALLPDSAAAPNTEEGTVDALTARSLMRFAFCDLFVFFAVVLVGFFYVWKRGDLEWVRSMTHGRPPGDARSVVSSPTPLR